MRNESQLALFGPDGEDALVDGLRHRGSGHESAHEAATSAVDDDRDVPLRIDGVAASARADIGGGTGFVDPRS